MTLRVLHVLDHSIPLHSGYTFRTLAILREQRRLGWETFHLTSPKHAAAQARGNGRWLALLSRTAVGTPAAPGCPGLGEMALLRQLDATHRRGRCKRKAGHVCTPIHRS